MDRKDLYWLAGLLEGEGSFMKGAPCEAKYPRIKLHMTDLDIIQRVATLFEIKYICTIKEKNTNWKDSYSILVKGKRAVRIMNELYPLMGTRRKQQIENAIGYQPITEEYESSGEDWFQWLAGLLEGEGSFMKGTPSKPQIPRIHLKMTDNDIIERAANILKVSYYGPYKVKSKNSDIEYKPHYIMWGLGKRAVELMKQLRPLMGERRQGQIDVVIASYAPKPRPRGEQHPHAKLNAEQVSTIKSLIEAGVTLTKIAQTYGVDIGLIWQIKAGRIWQHVT